MMLALVVEAVAGAMGLVLAVYGILAGVVGVEIIGMALSAIAWGMLLEQLLRGGRD